MGCSAATVTHTVELRTVREDAESRVQQARADAEAVRTAANKRVAEAREDARAEIARLEALLDRAADRKK